MSIISLHIGRETRVPFSRNDGETRDIGLVPCQKNMQFNFEQLLKKLFNLSEVMKRR